MDRAEMDLVAAEADALEAALESERFRHVAGIAPDPDLGPLYDARSRAAHRRTALEVRESGDAPLAARIASLRADRVAAPQEEAWRGAEARAEGHGPRGSEPLAALEAALPREPDPERRRSLARAAAEAMEGPASAREAWAEARARARAEVGLSPDWDAVVAGDEALAASDDAWKDVSAFALRREPGVSGRGPSRADLLRALSLSRWDGLFRPGMLPVALKLTLEPLGLDLARVRIDDASRPAKWPGAHAVGTRVSFRARGGAPDWLDLVAATGRVWAAAAAAPRPGDARLGEAISWLLGSLLLEPRWLAARADVERRHEEDVVRDLALRRLLQLRADAAALRVAAEVERGLSGAAWREAHREALGSATGAAWEGVRASRDACAERLAVRVRGAAEGERLRMRIRETLDEDWWRNPRAKGHLAGLLAAGGLPEEEPAPAGLAAGMLAARLGGG